jgi:hypothetical protein
VIFPALFSVPTGPNSAPGGNVAGFVNNTAGDPAGFNKALPFSLNTGLSYTSPAIWTAGYRSFMVGFQVTVGSFELHFLELHPITLAVMADDNFATYTPADGHLGVGIGALAGNGGGGGGPLFTGGLDGHGFVAMQVVFKSTASPSTIAVFDGLWCSSV